MEMSVNSPAGLQDAAEPVAEGVAAVHMWSRWKWMKMGNEQQGDEQRRETIRGEEWEWNLNFRGDLWKQLDRAKETRFKTSTSLQRPICYHPDSALHILLSCQHQTISEGFTNRITCEWLFPHCFPT